MMKDFVISVLWTRCLTWISWGQANEEPTFAPIIISFDFSHSLPWQLVKEEGQVDNELPPAVPVHLVMVFTELGKVENLIPSSTQGIKVGKLDR